MGSIALRGHSSLEPSPHSHLFSTMTKPILYTYWRSSCAWRVRIALNIKGIDYEQRPVNLVTKSGSAADECYALNPAQKVPVFVHEGNSITESLAIIEYIDEVFPGPRLLPTDPVLRAKARAIALHIAAGIQPLQILRVMQKLDAEKEGSGAEWSKYWLTEGLKELEELLDGTAGKFAVGDELSIADLCIPSILYNGRRWGASLSSLPILLRLDASLALLPPFLNAIPDSQPDAPVNTN